MTISYGTDYADEPWRDRDGRRLDVVPDPEPDVAIPRVWRANDLNPAAQPRWLARNRIPRAAISLLVGDEGIGKSLMWAWVLGAVTTGRALPEFGIPARPAEDAVIVITEDEWTSTVRPRLEVVGVDLDRVFVICTDSDGSGAPTFPKDMYLISGDERDVVSPGLIVVDAWLDTVPSSMSVRDPQQARAALHPWKEAATKTGAAVLLLAHTNRVSTGNARDKYGATAELRKKARMTLFAQTDDGGHLLIGPEKSNTTGALPASKFRIDGVRHFNSTEDDDGTIPKLVCIGESDRTAREHIADKFDDGGTESESAPDRKFAEVWLRDHLHNKQPGTDSKDIKKAAKAADISERTLQRARKELGVEVVVSGSPPRSTWELPSTGSVPHDAHV